MTAEPAEVLTAKTIMTIVDGRIVYSAGDGLVNNPANGSNGELP